MSKLNWWDHLNPSPFHHIYYKQLLFHTFCCLFYCWVSLNTLPAWFIAEKVTFLSRQSWEPCLTLKLLSMTVGKYPVSIAMWVHHLIHCSCSTRRSQYLECQWQSPTHLKLWIIFDLESFRTLYQQWPFFNQSNSWTNCSYHN